jgi:hypothetical protein
MAKPTKKRIDEVAKKLFFAARENRAHPKLLDFVWRRGAGKLDTPFHRMAKYVLTELQPAESKTGYKVVERPAKQPKACRIDGGKRVCR